MALIKIEMSMPPVDGMDIKFKAPCDCSQITGLLVEYPGGNKEFTFRDCHGNNLAGIGNLFGAGAYVKVIVDAEKGYAYLQNADNNSFLNSAIFGTYTHTGDNLIGSGENGKFKATSSATISTINVNGVACSIRCGEESSIDLIAGNWYTFILDGDTVNFSSGGAGGGGLNFQVVGSPQPPASPKENCIWVNTDTPITSWHFGAEDISSYMDMSNAVNATNVVSGLGNGEISFKGDLSPMWSSTYIAKTRLVAGVTYVLASNLAYGRFSIGRNPLDSMDGVLDFVESINCGYVLTYERRSVELTPIITADYYIRYGTDQSGSNGKPAFATGILLYPKGTPVWIKTATSSPVAFNALKKNSIQVYPVSAKQYVNGAWVNKTAQSYQGGKWVAWVTDIYLYSQGDFCTSVTGGWNSLSIADGSNVAGTLGKTQNSTSVTLWAEYIQNTNSTAGYVIANSIDVTDFKSLTINATGFDGAYGCSFFIVVYTPGMTNWNTGTIAIKEVSATGTTTLDLSSVSGKVGIGIKVTNNYSGQVIKMTYDTVRLLT